MLKITQDRNRFWRNEKCQLHRMEGPAIEGSDGTREWWIDGKLHREDGPACEYIEGTKMWFINGSRHREDGPAMELRYGRKCWYLDGWNCTEEEYRKKVGEIC